MVGVKWVRLGKNHEGGLRVGDYGENNKGGDEISSDITCISSTVIAVIPHVLIGRSSLPVFNSKHQSVFLSLLLSGRFCKRAIAAPTKGDPCVLLCENLTLQTFHVTKLTL